jgi:hypothetical protein
LPDLNFNHFLQEGDAAARARFDNFTLALVSATRRSVRGMRPAHGDWGIDAFIGDLSSSIAIWQAKFFPDGINKSQKAQIRESYTSAKKAAAEHDYEIIAWTIVIPVELSPEERVWWEGWVARQKADGFAIELWELSRLQELLRSPDAVDVRAEYFPHLDPVHPSQPPPVLPAPPGTVTHDMLFVKQLQAAGLTELEVASEQFYNAEILERDLADKRLERQMAAYKGLRSDLRGTWADRYQAPLWRDSPGRGPPARPAQRRDGAYRRRPPGSADASAAAHPHPPQGRHAPGRRYWRGRLDPWLP